MSNLPLPKSLSAAKAKRKAGELVLDAIEQVLTDVVAKEPLDRDEFLVTRAIVIDQLAGGVLAAIDILDNVTYNYASHYCRFIDAEEGIRWLYGKTGAETLPKLEEAIYALAGDVDDDYWKPTEGNARRALTVLATWATLYPDGVWQGD